MLNVQVKFWTDRLTDRQTDGQQYNIMTPINTFGDKIISCFYCMIRIKIPLVNFPYFLPNDKILELPNLKQIVTSNFSFSHNVFHSYISLVRQNAALCGNGH